MSRTPGSWRYDVIRKESGYPCQGIEAEDGTIVCGFREFYGPGPADAALLAAAPDLLEALLDVQNQFLNPEEHHGGWRQRMADDVAAAIAKAVGGASEASSALVETPKERGIA